ncbi:Elongin-A [Mortierella claussenii]|nr:Elongin-A [Mortierella claussenii]
MAFTGQGHRLGEGPAPPTIQDTIGRVSTTQGLFSEGGRGGGRVPTLKDLCLNTLDRYIDLLEDIGTTPYYLIESILRKCNVRQLTRIELHTEGLEDQTDGLWYIHAKNEFKSVREGWPQYDESGEWRSKYHTMKQEDEDKLERKRAQLRQAYSQHDKVKQDRRVIMDPNLRLPKKAIRSSSTQMYNSNPYPPRSRTISSNGTGNISARNTESRRILAPTSIFAQHSDHIALGSAASRNDSALRGLGAVVHGLSPPSAASSTMGIRKRYSYKTRPVVYTGLSKPTVATVSVNDSTLPLPVRTSSAHKIPMPSASGAIVDFFKEINPAHSQHVTTSHRLQEEPQSRSPPSPIQPPSRTIRMLREDAGTTIRLDMSYEHSSRKPNRTPGIDPGARMEDIKTNGDYSWLEDDDDDDDFGHSYSHKAKQPTSSSPPQKKDDSKAKTPISLEEAGRQFFNQACITAEY